MNNDNQIKLGSLLSYAQMFLGVVISLLYTPIMLDLLGQSEYGLYNTVSSTISMLSLLSLGFNSGYIRYYSKYKQQNDLESIWKLNGLFLIIFSIIGVVAVGCGFFISFNLEMVFLEGLTVPEYQLARSLMIILTINLAISFPMSVFGNIISANEKFVFLKIIGIIKTVVSPLVTLPFLIAGFRSVAMVIVTLVISIIADAVYLFYVVKVLGNRFVFHGFEKGVFGSLFSYTAFIAINLVVDQVNWNIDRILLGRFKGTTAVAIYSVGYTLYQYYMMLSTSISSVFTPKIHRIVNSTVNNVAEQRKMLTELFITVGRIQFLVLGLAASGVVFFGKTFITRYWAGNEYVDSYYVSLLLIIPSSIALIQNIGIEIQRAKNKHKFRALVYSVMAIINVFLSIWLCQEYGSVGCAVGTAISLILANGVAMNLYYHFCCNIDIVNFWRSILRLSKGLIIPIIWGIVIDKYFFMDNGWKYLLSIIIYTIIYCCSMYFFGMNNTEKMFLIKPIKKIAGALYDKH